MDPSQEEEETVATENSDQEAKEDLSPEEVKDVKEEMKEDEDEEEEEEEEDEEEDEEPKLKYERIGNDIQEILVKDATSCMAVHPKFLALGKSIQIVLPSVSRSKLFLALLSSCALCKFRIISLFFFYDFGHQNLEKDQQWRSVKDTCW